MRFHNILIIIALFLFLVQLYGENDNEPEVTMMWNLWDSSIDIDYLRANNINTVWLHGNESSFPSASSLLQENGITAMPNYKVLDDKTFESSYPELYPRRFLSSVPQEASSSSLTIDVLKDMDAYYEIEEDSFYLRYWKVWDVTDAIEVTPEQWTYLSGKVYLTNAVSGHYYNVAFSCREINKNPKLDMFALKSRELLLGAYTDIISKDIGTIHRPTLFGTYFLNSIMSNGTFLDWYGHGKTLSKYFIQSFEEKVDRPFDISYMFKDGYVRSTNDAYSDGYALALELQQQEMQAHAISFTDSLKQLDRQVRMFWGDTWVGLNPSDPNFSSLGFEQIVTAINTPTDIRRLMSVSPQVKRVQRFGFWNIDTGDGMANLLKDWKVFLRAGLRQLPDGISIGGPDVTKLLLEEEGYDDLVKKSIDEFRFLHPLINKEDAFVHDLKVAIINAHGQRISWPREFTVNESQRLWNGLTDLPISVDWLNFEDVAMGKLTDNYDVVLCAGEPGTSWAGAGQWSAAIITLLNDYISSGGVFIGIDAPGVIDETCALKSILGVEFDTYASAASTAGIYNSKDRIRYFMAKNPAATTKAFGLKSDFASNLGVSTSIGGIKCNTTMKVEAVSKVWSTDNDVLLTQNNIGKGAAWYLSGVPETETGIDFFKRLLFYSTGKIAALSSFDCSTIGGFVYCYPSQKIIIAYNQEVTSNSLIINTGMFEDNTQLEALTNNVNSINTVEDKNIDVSIQVGEFAVWRYDGNSTFIKDSIVIPDFEIHNKQVYINRPEEYTTLKVFDISGKAMMPTVSDFNSSIDLSQLISGIYVIQLSNVDGGSVCEKVIF